MEPALAVDIPVEGAVALQVVEATAQAADLLEVVPLVGVAQGVLGSQRLAFSIDA